MNELYPIFLRIDKLKLLIVGGGYVGTEKLSLILKNSPGAQVSLVAKEFSAEISKLAAYHAGVALFEKLFEPADLAGFDLVIAATNLPELNKQVQEEAKIRGLLVNVADTPALCDFYLGSIVTKGDLKIAISTNGKSPTFAKRLREMLEEALPDNIPSILDKLETIRNSLKGDFADKIRQLDEITAVLSKKEK
jgi:precorrin-2 dehydrogenase / sirohydrochlorin ferrochelatase